VIHAALNVQSGQLVRVLRERHRQDDAIAFIEVLGNQAPAGPKLLIWDNAPPHHPKRVLQAAKEVGIEIGFLPFRSPELNPCEDLWRGLKSDVAANRTYASMEELGERALAWMDALSPDDVLRRSGLLSSKFQWLST
jgi:transposase